MDVRFEIAVFACHLAATPSARVCLMGNTEELGHWDSTHAVPLELVGDASTAEKKFAVTVHFPMEREFHAIEYKYLIKDTAFNNVVSWETIPGSRTFTLTHATNAARGKPAKQSSTYTTDRVPCPGPRPASLGTDGNHNGFYEWRCPRTTREPNPWWSVDLETTVELQHLNLWKAMTYHEQPKRSTARPAISSVAAATSASSQPAPRVWVFVSTDDLSDRPGEDLLKLLLAPGYFPEHTHAFQLDLREDARVESINMGGVKGRYVRIQHDSPKSTMQFSELEIFSKISATGSTTPQLIKRKDGFYGVNGAPDGDLEEFIDSEWVDPRGDNALVRFWIGSFQKDVPAIQWFDGSNNLRPVHVAFRHQLCTRLETPEGVKLDSQSIPVDARGASLLDKDGAEFRESLTAYLHHNQRDLKPYLNSTQAKSIDEWLQRFTNTELFDDDQLTRLRSEATTRTFLNGETLLKYGERTRMAFFIIEGDVLVKGPSTVSGSETLGVVAASTAINDLALFSAWAPRSASFIAKGHVVVQIITFESLKSIVGETKLQKLRTHLLRERHALDSTPSSDPQGQLLVVDANHAQVFRTKLPMSALSDPSSKSVHRFTIEIHEAADFGTATTTNQERGVLLGSAPLVPNQLSQHGEGYTTLPILSKPDEDGEVTILGQVKIHYLVIRPFVHPRNDLSNVWRSYWRERAPQGGGHRGMGRHFNQVGGFRKALTRENTLASFILAGRSGADFVEFDVQLTKDHVPVLYHDFIFRVGLEDKTAWTQGARAEQHAIAIHQLTLRELTRSQTSVVPHKDQPLLKRLIKKHWRTLLSRNIAHGTAKTILNPGRGIVGVVEPNDEHLVDFYPRLEDLIKHVPPEIGLNIEIKYPDNFKRSAYRFSPSFAINYYIDKILQCVFDHASVGRRIFFSCFDPDIVVALQAKQATYPVFFLTYGRVQAPVFDARLTLQFAHNFAKMEKLRGIVSNSDEFIVEPACAELIKRDGLVLHTWGDQNTSHECVQLQKRHAVDGVISDNIGDLTRQDEKLASVR